MNFFQRLTDTFSRQGNLAKLIIINVIVFLIVNFSYHLARTDLSPYLELQIGGSEFIFKIWTVVTYMFVHHGIFELFFNMLLLYFSSQLYFLIFGEKKLIYLYLMSGICGAALLLILGLLIPGSFFQTSLSGASSAVLGVIMVMAVYSPNYRVAIWGIFELAYKYFALIVFILSTLIDFSLNTGGKIAHIGGVLFGLIYGYYLKKGVDLFEFSLFKPRKTKLKVVSHNKVSDAEFNQKRKVEEQTMDELLDKISKSGYDSLTKNEKEILFKLSQKK
jgi:membrane associated rhomboid family serine protease